MIEESFGGSENFYESISRLTAVSYKQLAMLAERKRSNGNKVVSLAVIFVEPDEIQKKRSASLWAFLTAQGIKAEIFFAEDLSVIVNRTKALAWANDADTFLIITKNMDESGLLANAAHYMKKSGIIFCEGIEPKSFIVYIGKEEIRSFFAEESLFSYPLGGNRAAFDEFCLCTLCVYAVNREKTLLSSADLTRKMLRDLESYSIDIV